MLVASLLELRSFTQFCESLYLASTLAASLDMLEAMWRQDQAGRGSFNYWNEALTFHGVALFTHMLHKLHP